MNLNEIKSVVRLDKLILNEIKSTISKRENLEIVFELQSKLQYKRSLASISEFKKNLVNNLISNEIDKILKLEKEILKIKDEDFNICLLLNSIGINKKLVERKVEKKELKKAWTSPLLEALNDDFIEALCNIKEENIPVLINRELCLDLVEMPHLLVAGQTGSGKSVFLNSFIVSMIYKVNPEKVKLLIIDPKRVEFSLYKNIPHLWRHIATDINVIEKSLNELVEEMDRRYKEFEKFKVKNIKSYNEKTRSNLNYIVCVIDELSDLMMIGNKDLENNIIRLAQLARACGIHLILATQKPVVKVITGLIKSNIPSRISFKVSNKLDSRIILDCSGAEKLKGKGDMMILINNELKRFQGLYVSEEEIRKIVNE